MFWLRFAFRSCVCCPRGREESCPEWSTPVHDDLGLAPFLAAVPEMLSAGNGAMRQAARFADLGDARAMHAEVVERTRRSAEEALEMAAARAA